MSVISPLPFALPATRRSVAARKQLVAPEAHGVHGVQPGRRRTSRGVASNSSQPHGTLEATLERTADVEAASERPKPWWQAVEQPANMVSVRTASELRAVLRKASASNRSRLVAIEFIAGHCAACRSLYPKLCRIAADEFREVLFVKVVGDEAAPLAQALGVQSFPLVQLFRGSAGKVAEFTANLSAESLARLRLNLRVHSAPFSTITPGQIGPAALLHAPGWPELSVE